MPTRDQLLKVGASSRSRTASTRTREQELFARPQLPRHAMEVLSLQRQAGNQAVANLLRTGGRLGRLGASDQGSVFDPHGATPLPAVQRIVAEGGEDLKAATAGLQGDNSVKEAGQRLNLAWKQLFGMSRSSATSPIGTPTQRQATGQRILGVFDQIRVACDLFPELGKAPKEVIRLMEALAFERPMVEKLMKDPLPEGVNAEMTFAFGMREMAGGASALDTSPSPQAVSRDRIETPVVDRVNRATLKDMTGGGGILGGLAKFVQREDVVLLGENHPPTYIAWAKQGGSSGSIWMEEKGGLLGKGMIMCQGIGSSNYDDFEKAMRRVTAKKLRFQGMRSSHSDKFQRGLSSVRKKLRGGSEF